MTKEQLLKMAKLDAYSDRYQLGIQLWPNHRAIFISKDDVELTSFGGYDLGLVIEAALDYLDRINGKGRKLQDLAAKGNAPTSQLDLESAIKLQKQGKY